MNQNELYHVGVLGMKWGQRKAREKEYRGKLKAMVKRYDTPTSNIRATSDVARLKYRDNPAALRVGQMATATLLRKIGGDMLTGKIGTYGNMTRSQLVKEVADVAVRTSLRVAVADSLAKSASKNYDDTGKVKKGVNTKALFTKEDVIARSVAVAVNVIPIANWALKTKYTQSLKDKEYNQRTFEKWGARILPEKVSDTIWL